MMPFWIFDFRFWIARSVRRKAIFFSIYCLLFALCGFVNAQQPKKVPLIGFLEGASISESQGVKPFRQGLHELGYVEGKNIQVEYRYGAGRVDRAPGLVAELV